MAEFRAFLKSDETASELLNRISADPLTFGVPFIDRRVRLRPHHFALLSGVTAAGKTELLVQVAAATVLPKAWQGYDIGGQEGVCVFIDLDLKFDVWRLGQVLLSRLQNRLAEAPNGLQGQQLHDAIALLLEESLGRLRLVRCHDSLHLLATLKVLPALVETLKPIGPTKVVLIDNLSATSWLDRAARGPDALGGPQIGAAIAAHIRQLAAARIAVIATNHVLPPRAEEPLSLAKELGVSAPVWQAQATQHLFLYQLPRDAATTPATFGAEWLVPSRGKDRFCVVAGAVVEQHAPDAA